MANDAAMMLSTISARSHSKKSGGSCLPPPLVNPRHNQPSALALPLPCAQESGVIDENTQSGWRMIV